MLLHFSWSHNWVISVENCANYCKSILIFHSVESIWLNCIFQMNKRGFMVIKGHRNPLNFRHLAVFSSFAWTEVDWVYTGEFPMIWCSIQLDYFPNSASQSDSNLFNTSVHQSVSVTPCLVLLCPCCHSSPNLDSNTLPEVSCGIYVPPHIVRISLLGSNLLVQDFPQMLDWIEFWMILVQS